MSRVLLGVAAAATLWAGTALAYEPLVEKQTFTLGDYTTVGGATIPDVKIGWEAYGTLNEAKDNAILIAHFYTGTSHAAGRYTEDGARGYWDKFIGSGKLIDTDKFYVLSSDTLVNLNVGDPNVVTTGPASINPETGAPYGMDFPIVTIRDFVNVQKALVESLGITKLHAVMGASMGGLQTIEWASAYPEMVGRAVPVISSGWADAFLIGWLNIWGAPIRLDPNWNGGDYYDGEPPVAGLAEALKIVTLHARYWQWADDTFGRNWAAEDMDPLASMDNLFEVEAWLDGAGAGRAAVSDANSFLYLAKANQLFMAGHVGSVEEGLAAIEAPVMLLPATTDLIFFPGQVAKTRDLIAADGTEVIYEEVVGPFGHLDGIIFLDQHGDALRAFLED